MAFSPSSRRALAKGCSGIAGQVPADLGCRRLVNCLGLIVIPQPRSKAVLALTQLRRLGRCSTAHGGSGTVGEAPRCAA